MRIELGVLGSATAAETEPLVSRLLIEDNELGRNIGRHKTRNVVPASTLRTLLVSLLHYALTLSQEAI